MRGLVFFVAAMAIACVEVQAKLAPFVVGTMNGRTRIVHRAGRILYLPKNKVTHLWLCQFGTLEHTCMQGAALFTPAKGCEVLTTECVCYRWEYAFRSSLATKGFNLEVRQDRNSPQCAVVTIVPAPDSQPETHKIHHIRLTWEIASYENILPPLLAYMIEKRYYTWGDNRKYPFFYYRQQMIKNICPANPGIEVGMDLACVTSHDIPFMFIDKSSVTATDDYSSGIQFLLFVSMPSLCAFLLYYISSHTTQGRPQASRRRAQRESEEAKSPDPLDNSGRYSPPPAYSHRESAYSTASNLQAPRMRVHW